jgi:hypothetical protein
MLPADLGIACYMLIPSLTQAMSSSFFAKKAVVFFILNLI